MKFITSDLKDLEIKAAEIIALSLAEDRKDEVILAIPGGRSVSGIFERLIVQEIDWKRVHIFLVDERIVPLDHEESNFRLAKITFIENLLISGKLPEKNVHPFRMDRTKSDFGISRYEDELNKYGGNFDVVLLSSGEDGHIGALYPDHHSINNDSESYLYMTDSPKPPPERMTMSRKLLLRSKTALLLFLGEGKREALKKFRDDSVLPESCPCKYVKEVESSYILTDLE